MPGSFDTDRLKANLSNAAQKTGKSTDDVAEARKKTIPSQRFGTSEEFGAICAFLCSQQAGYINGQNVLADGGATVIAQDEASSVVWGMPGAAATSGICTAVVPLKSVAGYINDFVAKGMP